MKKVLILVLSSFLLCGVVSAASLYGEYQGHQIIKVTSNGTELKASDVPAIELNDRTMVPVSLLEQIGLQVTWDGSTQTVDVEKPEQQNLLSKLSNYGVNGYSIQKVGLDTYAIANFPKQVDENADWSKMFAVMSTLSSLDAGFIQINYESSNQVLGTVSIEKNKILDLLSGKVKDISQYYKVTGKIFRTKLTVKDIAKLMGRVGIITTYDQFGKPVAQGSGFIVNPLGLMITNDHVIEGSTKFSINIDGKTYTTTQYLFMNKDTDVFGVYLDANAKYGDFNSLNYDTTLPEIGDKVYSIGSPDGLTNTLQEGIVSGIRTINGMTMIQHTANTDHGSSGGVLLNEYGDVIGITSSGIDGTNLDFAIPMKYVQDELDKFNNK